LGGAPNSTCRCSSTGPRNTLRCASPRPASCICGAAFSTARRWPRTSTVEAARRLSLLAKRLGAIRTDRGRDGRRRNLCHPTPSHARSRHLTLAEAFSPTRTCRGSNRLRSIKHRRSRKFRPIRHSRHFASTCSPCLSAMLHAGAYHVRCAPCEGLGAAIRSRHGIDVPGRTNLSRASKIPNLS